MGLISTIRFNLAARAVEKISFEDFTPENSIEMLRNYSESYEMRGLLDLNSSMKYGPNQDRTQGHLLSCFQKCAETIKPSDTVKMAGFMAGSYAFKHIMGATQAGSKANINSVTIVRDLIEPLFLKTPSENRISLLQRLDDARIMDKFESEAYGGDEAAAYFYFDVIANKRKDEEMMNLLNQSLSFRKASSSRGFKDAAAEDGYNL